jgi:hypothetical protein
VQEEEEEKDRAETEFTGALHNIYLLLLLT